MTTQLLRQSQFSATHKQEKPPESVSKREHQIEKSVDEIMLRVHRAEGRLATIESELQVLDERMKAASDILGSPKKKKKRSSSRSIISSSTGSKKKISKRSGNISPIKLPKIKESEEVQKLINLNANYRQEGPLPWNRFGTSDLVNLSKTLNRQTSVTAGKTMRSNAAHTGANKIRILSKVNDPVSSTKNAKHVKTIRKANKPAPKTMSNSKGSAAEFIDPTTGRRILNPVRNMWCMHVYEKSTITKLIEGSSDVLCPHPGCTNKMPVNVLDLVAVEKKPVKEIMKFKRNVQKSIPARV